MPSTVIRSSTLADATPRSPPKRCSSRARFFGPTPAISWSWPPPVRTLARAARMPVIAKRWASSRICATSISPAQSLPSQFFQAHLAAFALFHAHDARQIQAQGREPLARHADLALAAVDQHQVGQARLALRGRSGPGCTVDATGFVRGLGQLAVAAREHLAHRGVVVTAGDAIDLVAAVLAALHLVVVEH